MSDSRPLSQRGRAGNIDPDRIFRAALIQTWRRLRLSIARGRPITLPNLLRLHRRRLSCHNIDVSCEHRSKVLTRLIEQAYRQDQPFLRVPPLPTFWEE